MVTPEAIKFSLAVVMSCIWLLGIIIIYWVKSLTQSNCSRWSVFFIFTFLTTFLIFKVLGTGQYALLNITIIIEPLILCALVGLANIKLRKKRSKFNSLLGVIFYLIISVGFFVYGQKLTREKLHWKKTYQDMIIILHVGIVLGCLMFLLSLNSSAKWNSRYRLMSSGEHISCALGIYIEIIICVSLALCIIFSSLIEEE